MGLHEEDDISTRLGKISHIIKLTIVSNARSRSYSSEQCNILNRWYTFLIYFPSHKRKTFTTFLKRRRRVDGLIAKKEDQSSQNGPVGNPIIIEVFHIFIHVMTSLAMQWCLNNVCPYVLCHGYSHMSQLNNFAKVHNVTVFIPDSLFFNPDTWFSNFIWIKLITNLQKYVISP